MNSTWRQHSFIQKCHHLIQNYHQSFVPNEYVSSEDDSHYKITLANLYKYGFHRIAKTVFFITLILSPIINNILGSYGIYSNDKGLTIEIIQIINIIFFLIGLSIIYILQGGIIFKTGAGAYILFKLFTGPIIILISSILGMLFASAANIEIAPDITIFAITMISIQVVIEIIFCICFFLWNDTARQVLKNTLKSFLKVNQLLFAISLISILFVICYLLNMFFNSMGVSDSIIKTSIYYASNNISNGSTSNQNIILSLLRVWWGILIISPLVLFIAPVAEELAFREGIFSVFGKKVYFPQNARISKSTQQKCYEIIEKIFISIAVVATFANTHVSGEIQHILLYFGSSIGFGIIYLFARNNFTYSIILHIAWNIMAYSISMVHNGI